MPIPYDLINELLLYMAIGFAAQMVDGATGMAFGISATSALLAFGVPPASASASVHAAEIATTGIAGASHWRLRHVRWVMVARLAIPGALGGILGAYFLSEIEADFMRPIVSLYLLAMGVVIMAKALRRTQLPPLAERRWPWLGASGGFLDAIGGGGWGPIVVSTLIGRSDHPPRVLIGSVIMAEFFVTAAISAMFFAQLGITHGVVIVGLILGGALAAPFAAHIARALPDRAMMILVGAVVIFLSLRGIISALG